LARNLASLCLGHEPKAKTPKVAKPSKSIKHDFDFDQTLINKYTYDYHELQPHNIIIVIGHLSKSQITKVS
jgi:hypothetical protein